MLTVQLLGTGRRFRPLPDALAVFWQAAAWREELRQLLLLLADRADHRLHPLPWTLPIPLRVHGHNSRAEIEAAFGVLTAEAPWIRREGVLWHQSSATDLLFITLRKSEALFSPSTRYRDLALGPGLFHWESQSNSLKEARIISTLEPVMNQHNLVVDTRVWQWDYSSNKDMSPDMRVAYMLGYQMSRVCDEAGALRHDDRLDALAIGVKWFTDVLAVSATKQEIRRKQERFAAMQKLFDEAPHAAVEAMATGRDFAVVLGELRSGGRRRGKPSAWIKPRR